MGASLVATVGWPAATFVVCTLSAIIPLIHAEAYLVTVSALTTGQDLVLLTALGAFGQMLGKSLVYLGGRGVLTIRNPRLHERVDRWRQRIEAWGHKRDLLLFASSASGFPPFMIVAFLGGALSFPFKRFFVLGLAGRLIRFGAALAIPQLIKAWA